MFCNVVSIETYFFIEFPQNIFITSIDFSEVLQYLVWLSFSSWRLWIQINDEGFWNVSLAQLFQFNYLLLATSQFHNSGRTDSKWSAPLTLFVPLCSSSSRGTNDQVI